MKTTLPKFFKPILWSYNFTKVNPIEQKKSIIVNSINYGDLHHWAWIKCYYGLREVQKILTTTPTTAIRPQALALATLIFKLKKLNHAPRGTTRKK